MHPTHTLFLLGSLALTPIIQAHYIFSQLLVNDTPIGQDYTYVRKNTNTYMPSFTSEVISSPDAICNKGAHTMSSQTLTVKAGDKVGFKLAYNELIEHPSPGFIYMSKAPGDVNDYKGDGDWFKVWESGVNGPANVDTNWGTWQKPSMTFTIPKDLPDGEYLVRPEHIAIHEAHVGKAQFYMECAQLSVSGGGNGTPGPLVKIPGLYSAEDPGIAYNIWTDNPAPYVMPGPKVWSGRVSSGSNGGDSTSPAETPAETGTGAGNGNGNGGSSSSSASTAGFGSTSTHSPAFPTTFASPGNVPPGPGRWMGGWNSRVKGRSAM
ncbi:endo-1,4-beta-glucanase glycosyl hydrolase family 61 [Zymoseptoria tritici IPO323]|uniref:AA9 family lytic polysaccharide monooxygenase n=1 Tax=Zymoseptoria tritici (strain CBS 115943 / IPO323) TaxID=336722 RepID=F9WWQ8_ZYMTI|nr:endo-1,4-beta-glucanase glycosyl hydrolase family 61 [Zymoseptoria tritici IPO323]EGP91468.1 endo-1,4-beta-glucanase glycosyl hydrolase family 61 [Zymoseptoria tritici IPO323]